MLNYCSHSFAFCFHPQHLNISQTCKHCSHSFTDGDKNAQTKSSGKKLFNGLLQVCVCVFVYVCIAMLVWTHP